MAKQRWMIIRMRAGLQSRGMALSSPSGNGSSHKTPLSRDRQQTFSAE
jgi:hypothetical protein